MNTPKTIKVDNIEYVRKDGYVPAQKLDGLEYVIVRTYSAGVFAGYLKSRNGQEVVLLQARRLWYWDGAASLSQLSTEGVGKPENCKFPQEVEKVELLQAIEILSCTEEARQSINSVKVWKS
jgi:hypothetical protein